jgi:hypothetical protein
MYIVVYSLREGRPDGSFFGDSDWSTHETLEEAQKEYEALLDHSSIYSASICSVVKSTDYSPAENNKIGDLDRLNQDL